MFKEKPRQRYTLESYVVRLILTKWRKFVKFSSLLKISSELKKPYFTVHLSYNSRTVENLLHEQF